MIRASRRSVMAGAIAVPTLSGLAAWRWRHGEGRVLLHDPSLEAGRRFAAAAEAQGVASRAIAGERIRLAQEVLGQRPALIAGVSRGADLLLISEAAREAGYRLVAEFEGRGSACSAANCHPGWNALGRLGASASQGWVEALAGWAADPRGAVPSAQAPHARPDAGLVLGWVLAQT